jgi:beta-glucosidase/6-phospho-beta-glucosidase/beta-galactosidase
MNTRITLVLGALAILLAACSDNSGTPKTAQQQTAPQPQAAAPQQAMPAGHQMSAAQQAAIEAAKGLPKQGKVLEMMHAAGYTYMKVDTGQGEPVWIAATMMRVKPEQQVQWTDAAVMKNFPSKTLHRTFDEILFVSNASVVQ